MRDCLCGSSSLKSRSFMTQSILNDENHHALLVYLNRPIMSSVSKMTHINAITGIVLGPSFFSRKSPGRILI